MASARPSSVAFEKVVSHRPVSKCIKRTAKEENKTSEPPSIRATELHRRRVALLEVVAVLGVDHVAQGSVRLPVVEGRQLEHDAAGAPVSFLFGVGGGF